MHSARLERYKGCRHLTLKRNRHTGSEMKTVLATIIAFPLSLGIAFAETSDRSAFVSADLENVTASADRRTDDPAQVRSAKLSPASAAEVDADGDGQISFAELLRHDTSLGF